MARFANGAVVLAMEETKVLSTVASGKGDAVRDFLPLTVRLTFPCALAYSFISYVMRGLYVFTPSRNRMATGRDGFCCI